MSNIISDSVIVYRRLEKVYKESIHKTLETPCNQLKEIFSNLLDQKSAEYSLRKDNSVYDTKYYYLKTRVKDPESFYEKLIRKELGIVLTNNLDLLGNDDSAFNQKKAQVVSAIQKIDDIIGLRIVTELKCDCKSVHNLLKNSAEFFLQHQIKLENISVQPEKMRNGLDIYRIKGMYQDLYGFELQIKSKIDETWGDLDHTLFYKDYTITPIKDTVQITMNNVGLLLDKIETLLYDLRESGGKYDLNAAFISLQKSFEDELGPILKAKYGVTYNIKELAPYLQYFKSKINVGDATITDLDFDLLELAGSDSFIESYKSIRQRSLVLMNLEAIYLNWLQLSGKEVKADNIDEILLNYIFTVRDFIISNIHVNEFDFNSHFDRLVSYGAGPEIFLDTEMHKKSIAIQNRIFEILRDEYQSEEDIMKGIAHLFSVNDFKGNINKLILDLKNEGTDIDTALFEIKSQVEKSNNDIDKSIGTSVLAILETLAS